LGSVCPVETSTRSTPASVKASAITRVSLPVVQTASIGEGLVARNCSTTFLVTFAVHMPLTLPRIVISGCSSKAR